jgi:hypothetical protein
MQTSSPELRRDYLTVLFGDNARTKLIKFFLENEGNSYTPTQIGNLSPVSRETWYQHKDDLIGSGLIETAGGNNQYTLNKEHNLKPVIEAIYRYNSTT